MKTIECLLSHDANIHLQDMNGATALHRAVRTRCAAAVRVLLQAGADPSAKTNLAQRRFTSRCKILGVGARVPPRQLARNVKSLNSSLRWD